MKRPEFPPALYPLWCRAWLLVTTSYSQRLAQWLADHVQAEIAVQLNVSHQDLEKTLHAALAKLEKGTVNGDTLVRIYGCLREIEALYRADPRRQFGAPPETKVNAIRYVLLPPVLGTVRKAYPDKQFKLSGEIAIAGQLGLEYRWLPLQADTELDWKSLSDLDPLRKEGSMRVGLAPCAIWGDMSWRIDEGEARGMKGNSPLQCKGARDVDALWAAIETILSAAYEQQVQVLLFPELVLDMEMLDRTRAWLKKHNLVAPRLRLVVAGSRHCPEGEDWSNRCTVLGQGGQILWEQDKRTPFVQDDRAILEQMLAGCSATSAFEPTRLGKRVIIRESAAGRLLTPICLDYIEDELWSNLGADLFLVPAMTGSLTRFMEKAKEMGGKHGAASLVCNAKKGGDHRFHAYLPITEQTSPAQVEGIELFTIDPKFRV